MNFAIHRLVLCQASLDGWHGCVSRVQVAGIHGRHGRATHQRNIDRTLVVPLVVAVLLTALVGCQSPQSTAREQATQRWNVARAQVKARLAADQFEAGNVAAAAGELAEAERLTPDNPDLIPLRVRLWLAEGKIERAADLLERTQLAEWERGNVGTWERGNVGTWERGDVGTWGRGDVGTWECGDEEEPRASARAVRDRRQAEIEYLLGVVRQQQQRWEDALAAYQRAAEIDDEEITYVVAVAQTWLQLGRPQAGLRWLQTRAARFKWTNAYQAALAECHEQLEDWPAAASAWQRIAGTGDAEAGLRQRLATALYRSGRYADAIPVLASLINVAAGLRTGRLVNAEDLENSSGLPRLMLAECYLAERRPAEAQEHIQWVIQREPENVQALRLLARNLGMAGKHAQALRVTRRALGLAPNDVRTLELAAALAWRTGARESAASTAERLLKLDAQNPVAHHVLDQIANSE